MLYLIVHNSASRGQLLAIELNEELFYKGAFSITTQNAAYSEIFYA